MQRWPWCCGINTGDSTHFSQLPFEVGIIVTNFHTQSPKRFKRKLYYHGVLIGGELNLSKISFSGVDLSRIAAPAGFLARHRVVWVILSLGHFGEFRKLVIQYSNREKSVFLHSDNEKFLSIGQIFNFSTPLDLSDAYRQRGRQTLPNHYMHIIYGNLNVKKFNASNNNIPCQKQKTNKKKKPAKQNKNPGTQCMFEAWQHQTIFVILELPSRKIWKADVSSFSPSSERMTKS